MDSLDFITLLCIASPHILYAAIWYLPEIWRAQFGRDSVLVFAHVATAGKGMPSPDTSLPCLPAGIPAMAAVIFSIVAMPLCVAENIACSI